MNRLCWVAFYSLFRMRFNGKRLVLRKPFLVRFWNRLQACHIEWWQITKSRKPSYKKAPDMISGAKFKLSAAVFIQANPQGIALDICSKATWSGRWATNSLSEPKML